MTSYSSVFSIGLTISGERTPCVCMLSISVFISSSSLTLNGCPAKGRNFLPELPPAFSSYFSFYLPLSLYLARTFFSSSRSCFNSSYRCGDFSKIRPTAGQDAFRDEVVERDVLCVSERRRRAVLSCQHNWHFYRLLSRGPAPSIF